MAADDWRVLAGRITGDGGIDIIETELPMTIGSIDRNLSAPTMMDGTITNRIKRLQVAGKPLLVPGQTVLIAEAAGLIRGMTLYRVPTYNGPSWSLDQVGLPGFAIGRPYEGEASFTGEDPLNIFRHIWDHIQTQPRSNLGITIDPLTSPVRVGTPLVEGDNNTGPRELNWWTTTDLGNEIDGYAKETPFDWLEKVYWDGDVPHCHLALGYPQLGGRKDHMRLVLGENLASQPEVTQLAPLTQVVVLGVGEGRDRIRGYAGVSDDTGLRHVKTVEDETCTTVERANAVARDTLNAGRGEFVFDRLEVYQHPNAPLEAIELGDELPLYAEMEHATVDQWVRIVGKSESPQLSDRVTLTVMRGVQA